MKRELSESVGSGSLADGTTAAVYRALRPRICSICGSTIAEGALFTRWPVEGHSVRISSRCEKCAPFIIDTMKTESSPLLQSLLTPPTGSDARKTHLTPERVAEEVERRLGPALRRTRRSRF